MNKKFWLLMLVCLVLGVGVIYLISLRRSTSQSIGELFRGKVPAVTAYSNMVLEGEVAYRDLASILTAQESEFDRLYNKCRGLVPQPLRDQLPLRTNKEELRRVLGRSVALLGPIGSRAIVPAIEQAVEYSDDTTSLSFIRTLEWSIPDSARSVKILSNYLAKARPDKLLLSMSTAHEIYAHVPQLAPLMQPWLHFSFQAGEAAEALGAMGDASAFAVSDLAKVSEFGVAGDPPKFQLRLAHPSGETIQILNRGRALIALGKIGVTNETVLAAFEKALPETNRMLRCNTADGLAALGSKALPLLPILLANLATNDHCVLRYQMEAIGRMGSAAVAAIPTLLKYCDFKVVQSTLAQPDIGRHAGWNSVPMDLPYAAAFALAQVHPASARDHGETLARALCYPRIPFEAILSLRPLAPDLLLHANPLLEREETTFFPTTALAGNLLILEPNHEPAKAVLERTMNSKGRASCYAAIRYLQATGDKSKPLAVFRNALNSDGALLINALVQIRDFGPAGKPLVPELQRLLQNPDSGIRANAGRGLLAIAPEALPQVE